WPPLRRRASPATLSAPSSPVQPGTPVFRLLAQGASGESRGPVPAPPRLDAGMVGALRMTPGPERTEAMWRLIRQAEESLSEPERQALADRIAAALGVDLSPVRDGRLLSLASVDELSAAVREGLDVQLHTH